MDDVFPGSLLPQKSQEQLQGGDERIKEGGNLSLVTQWKAGWTVSDLSMVTTGRRRTICLLALFFFFKFLPLVHYVTFLLSHARDKETDIPSITVGWTVRWSEGFEGGDRMKQSAGFTQSITLCHQEEAFFPPSTGRMEVVARITPEERQWLCAWGR